MMLRGLAIGLDLGLSVELSCAESVDVKYRGFVDLGRSDSVGLRHAMFDSPALLGVQLSARVAPQQNFGDSVVKHNVLFLGR
jgi:hypothetical protein